MCENQIVKRGEIYIATFSEEGVGHEQTGSRPVLILQNDIGNRFSTTTIVAPLTTRLKQNMPTHVYLKDLKSNLLLEQVRTISKLRLGKKIGEISKETLTEVNIRLAFSLGLINM